MRRLLLSILPFLLMTACSKDPSSGKEPVDPAPEAITLSDNSFSFPQSGGSVSLKVTAPARPRLAGLPEWVKFTDGTYDKDSYSITFGFTAAANETYEIRECVVSIAAEGTGSVSFTLQQEGREAPDVPTPGTDPEGWESAATAVRNMGAGWNLGNSLESNSGDVTHMWLEAWSDRSPSAYETAWGQPVTTRALIHMFKEAGFNTIRVPVTWYPHMGTISVDSSEAWDMSSWTGYDVDPVWMARVKEVVDYVIDEGMYCILNVHHDTGAASTAWLVASEADYKAAETRYQALWQQIADTFADYGEKLLFESFNEMLDPYDSWCFASFAAPAGYDAAVAQSAYSGINSYAKAFVETVRATGGNNALRNLVVNTYGACSGDGTWNNHLKDPLSSLELPEVPGHIAVEVHSYWEAVKFEEQKTDIDRLFSNLDQYLVRRLGVPVIIGEWGGGEATDEQTVRFAGYFSQKAHDTGIAALMWMGLSDGTDRAVPAWTMPRTKEAILKPYLP